MIPRNQTTAAATRERNKTLSKMADKGMTHPEISEVMELTLATVRMSISRHRRSINDAGIVHMSGLMFEADRPEFDALVAKAAPTVDKVTKGEG